MNRVAITTPAPRRSAPIDPPEASAVVDALPDPACLYDPSGAGLAANRAFRERFGAAAARDLRRLAGGLDPVPPWPESSAWSEECQWTADASWHRVRACATAGGALLVVVDDLSMQRAAQHARAQQQEQLAYLSRMMTVGEMASTLAHEINQPLAAVLNCVEVAEMLARREGALSDHLARALDLARRQAQHAAGVVARVRDFVRAREPRLSLCRPERLLADADELLRIEAAQRGVRLETRCAADVPPVLVDPVMVCQVLLNLGRNAMHAVQDQPLARRRVALSARCRWDGSVEFRVADLGPGLTLERERDLFAPCASGKPDGLGVGLSICRSIAELHHGRLFHERGADCGAEFVLVVPPGDVEAE